jgi:glyoxylase-like metal-dependent hydrolase (beta-lactamase superfamily II)
MTAVSALQPPPPESAWAVEEVAPGAWFVQRDWRSANHFVALAPRVTLIDTAYGPDMGATTEALAALSVHPADIRLIVNTHSHCDHVGGNAHLVGQSGAEVWMHHFEKARMDRHDTIATWWRFHDTWADRFAVDHGLADGDEIPFGPLRLHVVHAPGHAAGQIMLHDRKHRILFSADALWQGDMGVINTIVEGNEALELAVDTLRRIATLDIDKVYPGHGPAMGSPKSAIDRVSRKLLHFSKHPQEMHYDHICKMLAYIVLSKGGVAEASFFLYLMATVWFPRLVDAYFDGAYQAAYYETMVRLSRKGMLVRSGGNLFGVERKR